jgi:hypothetical protein
LFKDTAWKVSGLVCEDALEGAKTLGAGHCSSLCDEESVFSLRRTTLNTQSVKFASRVKTYLAARLANWTVCPTFSSDAFDVE